MTGVQTCALPICLLIENRRIFADRYARERQAVEQGNLTLGTVAPDLLALSDIDRQLADVDRQSERRRQDLDALIGLSPEVKLSLVEDISVPPVDEATVKGLLPNLQSHRPDLLALQLGYAAEEERVRAAILAQFPALVLGGTVGSDTSQVRSGGPSISIDLPIFNHNQGNVAIALATRRKLHDEYTSRLNFAYSEIGALLDEQALLLRQKAAVQDYLARAKAIARQGEAAYQTGNLDERSYVDLAVISLGKQEEAVALEQILLEQQVVLAGLLGIDMPVATIVSMTHNTGEASP